MAKALIPVGRVQVATPRTMALAVSTPTEAQVAVDSRIRSLGKGLVSEVIAEDPEFVGAGADAVAAAMSSGAVASAVAESQALAVGRPLVENRFRSPRFTATSDLFMGAVGGGAQTVAFDTSWPEDGGRCGKITWTDASESTFYVVAHQRDSYTYSTGEVWTGAVKIASSWGGVFRLLLAFYNASSTLLATTAGVAGVQVDVNEVATLSASGVVPAGTAHIRLWIQQATDDGGTMPFTGAVLRVTEAVLHPGFGPVPPVAGGDGVLAWDATADNSRSRFLTYSNPRRRWVAWGDSLTFGSGGGGVGTSYPDQLAALLSAQVVPRGIGGEASSDIAARQGGAPLLVRFTGDSIPASGSVVLSSLVRQSDRAASAGFMRQATNRHQPRYFTAAGVPGILRYENPPAGGPYRFTVSNARAAATAVPYPVPLVSDHSILHRGDKSIFWAGRNNYAELEQVLGDLRAMAAHLIPGTPYLVLTILNAANEASGSTAHGQIVALNQRILQEHGAHAIDVRRFLIDNGLSVAGITPTAQDLDDITNDVVPTSLRSDHIHLNAAGYGVVARAVADRIAQLQIT